MHTRVFVGFLFAVGVLFGARAARAEEPSPAEEQQEAAHPTDATDDGDATDATAVDDADDDADAAAPYDEFDPDNTGHADPELKKEFDEEVSGLVDKNIIEPDGEINGAEAEKELDSRPDDEDMKPSITADQFRTAVRLVKRLVLDRMEKKMAQSAAKKLRHFSIGIFLFSLLGLLLLLVPLFAAKKYPGKSGILFKYSALAAVTFFVTVNLFGGVLMGMRTVQTALGSMTNPSLAIAAGTFDTLDRNADEYIVMGKELFVPTLEQLKGNNDAQPSVVILENGQRLIKDAMVFKSVAKMFKKVDFVFKVLPIVLFGVTMLLFGLAIRPTLTEIVKLPMRAAAGEAGVGREVTRRALGRVWGELKATVCTIGVLAGLTILSAFVLGKIVGPALDALLGYFARSLTYLQFVDGASSGLVFLALFGVILFLVLNLAALILSMSFFLGKSQKIFQQRFSEGTPLHTHARFFKWGVLSVLLVQLLPLVYAFVADKVLLQIDHSMLDGVTDANQVAWTKYMLAGPAFLVLGFAVFFWAARGVKAIRFLQAYKVKQVAPRQNVPASENVHTV